MFIWPLSSKTGLSNSFTHLFLLDTLFQELWWGKKRWWLKACCSATTSRLYMDAHSLIHSMVFNWETQWAFQSVLGARIRYWSKSDRRHMCFTCKYLTRGQKVHLIISTTMALESYPWTSNGQLFVTEQCIKYETWYHYVYVCFGSSFFFC